MRSARIRHHAALLGVPEPQVRRDVLISHVLNVLTEACEGAGPIVFFGGTALCRTHLQGFRLSEDIDLLTERPAALIDQLANGLPALLRRRYPELQLTRRVRGETVVGDLADGLDVVRVQAVNLDHSYRQYPVGPHEVALLYEGLPEAVEFRTPTTSGAAAMKLNAWANRHLPRDLVDLYGLHQRGLLGGEAVRIAGRAATALPSHVFDDDVLPDEDTWTTALAAQMAEPPDRETAFHTVRAQIAAIREWPQADEWRTQAHETRV